MDSVGVLPILGSAQTNSLITAPQVPHNDEIRGRILFTFFCQASQFDAFVPACV